MKVVHFSEIQSQVFRENQWLDVKAGTIIFIPGNEEHNHAKASFHFS